MTDMTIKQFCDRHLIKTQIFEGWIGSSCKNMQELWEKSNPDWLIWIATRKNVLTKKELRLFSIFCCREIWHLLLDDRSKMAVEIFEKFTKGEAGQDELIVAKLKATEAYQDAKLKAILNNKQKNNVYPNLHCPFTKAARLVFEALRSDCGYTISCWARSVDGTKINESIARQAMWLKENTEPYFGFRPFVPIKVQGQK